MDKPNQTPLVLIVDDYAEGREICAEYLAFRGYRVATAEDGIDAIEKTRDLLPDVILMDLSLPRLDGWEASRRIRGDERTRHIPIIGLTGHWSTDVQMRAAESKMAAVLLKPCMPAHLLAEIQRVLASHVA